MKQVTLAMVMLELQEQLKIKNIVQFELYFFCMKKIIHKNYFSKYVPECVSDITKSSLIVISYSATKLY